MAEVTSSGQDVLVLVVWIVLYVAILGGVGALIGRRNDQPILGFVLGLFLGPIGWIVVAVLGSRASRAQ